MWELGANDIHTKTPKRCVCIGLKCKLTAASYTPVGAKSAVYIILVCLYTMLRDFFRPIRLIIGFKVYV